MRKLPSNILGTAIVALAFSVIAVGTVWASSAAYNKVSGPHETTTTVPGDEGNSDGEDPNNNDDAPDTQDPINIDDLYNMVSALSDEVSDLQSTREEQDLAVLELQKNVKTLTTQLETANTKVQTLSDSLTAIVPKLAKLNVDGTYTGLITPSQLTRKLTTDEISGEWPLDRTKGQLVTSMLKVEYGNCTPDSRYNVMLAVDPFRNITCVRMLK